jgi:hypothetical protein
VQDGHHVVSPRYCSANRRAAERSSRGFPPDVEPSRDHT